MVSPFLDPAACWDELHSLAARAGVSVEYLCATAQSATQFARDSVNAHKADTNQNLPYPTYDDNLEAVVRGLWDDNFSNDSFDFEIKQIPWNESEHPRDDRGRFTSGGGAGYSAQGRHGDAGINRTEIILPAVPAHEYQPPLRVMTAKEARDLLVEKGKRMEAVRFHEQKKLPRARDRLAELEQKPASIAAQQAVLDHRKRELGKEIKRLHTDIQAAEYRDIAELRKLLYVDSPTDVNVRFDAHPNFAKQAVLITSEHQKAAAVTGAEEVRRLVSDELIIGDVYFEQEADPDTRSNYGGNGRIKLSGDVGTRVVVHEFGHDLEARNPRIRDKAIEFLVARTKGEPLLKLSDVSPVYKDEEVYRKDKFINEYMGKIYLGFSATEIFSMGLEHFHSDPLTLAREDPDYFDFIYNALRGK